MKEFVVALSLVTFVIVIGHSAGEVLINLASNHVSDILSMAPITE